MSDFITAAPATGLVDLGMVYMADILVDLELLQSFEICPVSMGIKTTIRIMNICVIKNMGVL